MLLFLIKIFTATLNLNSNINIDNNQFNRDAILNTLKHLIFKDKREVFRHLLLFTDNLNNSNKFETELVTFKDIKCRNYTPIEYDFFENAKKNTLKGILKKYLGSKNYRIFLNVKSIKKNNFLLIFESLLLSNIKEEFNLTYKPENEDKQIFFVKFSIIYFYINEFIKNFETIEYNGAIIKTCDIKERFQELFEYYNEEFDTYKKIINDDVFFIIKNKERTRMIKAPIPNKKSFNLNSKEVSNILIEYEYLSDDNISIEEAIERVKTKLIVVRNEYIMEYLNEYGLNDIRKSSIITEVTNLTKFNFTEYIKEIFYSKIRNDIKLILPNNIINTYLNYRAFSTIILNDYKDYIDNMIDLILKNFYTENYEEMVKVDVYFSYIRNTMKTVLPKLISNIEAINTYNYKAIKKNIVYPNMEILEYHTIKFPQIYNSIDYEEFLRGELEKLDIKNKRYIDHIKIFDLVKKIYIEHISTGVSILNTFYKLTLKYDPGDVNLMYSALDIANSILI